MALTGAEADMFLEDDSAQGFPGSLLDLDDRTWANFRGGNGPPALMDTQQAGPKEDDDTVYAEIRLGQIMLLQALTCFLLQVSTF